MNTYTASHGFTVSQMISEAAYRLVVAIEKLFSRK